MAYDRYDSRRGSTNDRGRWSDDRYEGREHGRRDERGFFERAGDEIASWFGDDDRDRGRQENRSYGRDDDYRRERGRSGGGFFGGRPEHGADRDRGDWNQRESFGRERGRRSVWSDESSGGYDQPRGYRPMTGDYGRSEQFFAASGFGSDRGMDRDFDRDRSPGRPESQWDRDDYRRTSYSGGFGGARERSHDPHYHNWRQRQIDELDRDYDEYRSENQSRFESDFGNWRERRQQKRGMLGQIREHMEVVGNDDEHVGTVDRTAGDRIILTKSDPESGGAHHSLSCSDVDRVEGDRVILDCSAEQAKQRWRDENRSRALFEREDQGEMGPRALDRSFSGTYR